MGFFDILLYTIMSVVFLGMGGILFVTENKQRNELALFAPLLHDKELWNWSENQEFIQ